MADLRDEIADIVVPVAPASVPAAAAATPGLVAGGLVVAAGVLLLLAWLGWRARPARALAAIAAAAAQRRAPVPQLACRLDGWARARFRQARIDAARPPAGIDAAVWADWVARLERLRFAPGAADGHAQLAALCRVAGRWRRHA